MQFEEFDKPESLRVLNTSTLTTGFKSAVRNYDENKFKIVFLLNHQVPLILKTNQPGKGFGI